MKVVAALSGGVDSSVTAALLLEAGHQVLGITLKLVPDAPGLEDGSQRCCSVDDAADARAVCAALGIPFYVLDAREAFQDRVIRPFAAEYRAGRTPIPCLDCNTHLKFGHLLERARALDAKLATGHYAQVLTGTCGPELHRPVDPGKDQTYYLHGIGLTALRDVIFPVGGLRKDQVREHARRLDLPVHAKPDSQEVCFVAADGHARFVEAFDGQGTRPGRFLGPRGETLGEHSGVHAFTVGQRKGLGIHTRERLYVLRLDAATGDVHLGPEPALLSGTLQASPATWLAEPAELARLLQEPVQVRIRAQHVPAPAHVTLDGDGFRVVFREPQRAVAPGQAAVVYQGARCLGGGTILGP